MGILGELWVKLGLKNEGLNRGLDESKKKVSGFANYMSKLGGIMAAAFSVKEIVAFTHRTAELANKAAGVKRAFDALNNPNLLADLRRATMGTVDDLQLMQRAVQAKNFKIPLDQLATYLAFATKRANETGQSVDYLVDSIITGLGRQSVMILDNLGISAAEIRDNMKDGASMAEAVGKIIKEQMGEGAAEIDKAALATDRLTAAWTNFQMAFGGNTSGAWNWIKDKLAGGLERVTAILNSNNLNSWQKFFALMNPITGGIMSAAGTIDKALAQDAEEAELIGPVPREKNIEPIKAETEAVKTLVGELQKEIVAKERLNGILDTPLGNLFDADYIKEQSDKALAAIDAHYQHYIESLEGARQKQAEQIAMLDEMNEHFNQSIVAGISGGLQEMARAIMGVEGANLGTVVQALLSPMADALASAGEMIMAEGIAVEAFKKSLTSLQGAPAIAAGAALVAVAGAVKAGLQAIGNNPTAAGGYGNGAVTSYSGGYGVNASNYEQQTDNYILSTELKGQDLWLSIQRTQQNNRR